MVKQTDQPHSGHKPILVGIADKSPLMRTALRTLLNEDGRFKVVCICKNAKEFLQKVGDVKVDVAIVGWIIPPGDARFILDHIQTRADSPRVIVYSGIENDSAPAHTMAHGGAAFVSKNEEPDYLLDTVAEVARGRMVFPYLDVSQINANPLSTLTRRELEVLSSLAAGRTNKEIAAEKAVSTNTVKYHIRNLFEKLGVSNRGQAIALYLKS
jgi:two-component system nitrate/nitrite response regulator NarL